MSRSQLGCGLLLGGAAVAASAVSDVCRFRKHFIVGWCFSSFLIESISPEKEVVLRTHAGLGRNREMGEQRITTDNYCSRSTQDQRLTITD